MSSAIRRYVVSLPPTTVTTPLVLRVDQVAAREIGGAGALVFVRDRRPVGAVRRTSRPPHRALTVRPIQYESVPSRKSISDSLGVGNVVDARDRIVGQADDDQPVAVREREDVVVLLARDGQHHSRRGLPSVADAQHDVGALRRPQRSDRAAVRVLAGERAGPDAGGIDDARGPCTVSSAPVSSSRSRAQSPVALIARTRVRIRAPWAAAVRATATTSRASSSSWPSQKSIPPVTSGRTADDPAAGLGRRRPGAAAAACRDGYGRPSAAPRRPGCRPAPSADRSRWWSSL